MVSAVHTSILKYMASVIWSLMDQKIDRVSEQIEDTCYN